MRNSEYRLRVITGSRSDRVLFALTGGRLETRLTTPAKQAETRPVGSVSRRDRAAADSTCLPTIFSWDTGSWDKSETDLGQKTVEIDSNLTKFPTVGRTPIRLSRLF